VNLLSNTTFSSFDNTCHVSAAIGVGEEPRFILETQGTVSRVSNSQITPRPTRCTGFRRRLPRPAATGVDYAGEVANYYALRDIDGSIIGERIHCCQQPLHPPPPPSPLHLHTPSQRLRLQGHVLPDGARYRAQSQVIRHAAHAEPRHKSHAGHGRNHTCTVVYRAEQGCFGM